MNPDGAGGAPDDLLLMRLHVAALYRSDDHGRLLSVNEPRGGLAPRFFLGRTAAGNVCWLRHDVDAALADQLQAICEAQPIGVEPSDPDEVAAFSNCLAQSEAVGTTWSGPAYHFPMIELSTQGTTRVTRANIDLLSPLFDDWRADAEVGAPMVVVERDGRAVSVCSSARVTKDAHEAGVDTHPDYRGRGYAGQATAAWAHLVREMGRVPLYSTSWDNLASRATARKLGLRQFGADLHMR